jgi:Saxitoxin biosynthesis operon protein SxtJ
MALIKLNLKPTDRELRQFGFIALGAFGLLGALIFWRLVPLWRLFGAAAPTAAYVVWAVGALSALLSIVAPKLNRPLYVGLSVVAYPVGFVVSYVIMGAFFYLILTPLGLLFRLAGRDPLHRRFDASARSYWIKHKAAEKPARYFSQF